MKELVCLVAQGGGFYGPASRDDDLVDDLAVAAGDVFVARRCRTADRLDPQLLGAHRDLDEAVVNRSEGGERGWLADVPQAGVRRVLERAAARSRGDVHDVRLRLGSL